MNPTDDRGSVSSQGPDCDSDFGDLVFVVDDDPMIGDVVESLLEGIGYQVRVFFDPKVALASLRGNATRPALLLTDFRMPGMNGMELIQLAKRAIPNLKTILYSGSAGESETRQFSEQPDAFVRKPFHPESLTGTINSILKR